jgi:large conductance mechanosensitive channel
MPQLGLDESRESLMRAGEGVHRRAKRLWDGFTDFAVQDNVLEVAVGLM